MNCDNCKHYHWYYDYCDKWNCEMDARACNSCFEARSDVTKFAILQSNKEVIEMDLSDAFRRAFHPTPEEELEDLRRFVEIHNLAKSEKRCSTCTKWTPPPSGLPGFVENHGDCSDGHTVDTVKNCPDYVCSGDQCMNDIFSRIKELEKL